MRLSVIAPPSSFSCCVCYGVGDSATAYMAPAETHSHLAVAPGLHTVFANPLSLCVCDVCTKYDGSPRTTTYVLEQKKRNQVLNQRAKVPDKR